MRATLPAPMVTVPWRISRVTRENRDTFTVRLEPEEEGSSFGFRAGQFNMVYVFGIGEIPLSISSLPRRSGTMDHTTRRVGLVTDALGRLGEGDGVGVRGPFGSAWPLEAALGRDVVMVAGGIGLAPLRPVLQQLAATRKRYGKIVLLYGFRSPEEMIYRKDLEAWGADSGIHVVGTVDRAGDDWNGRVGVVTPLVQHVDFDASEAFGLVCGPEVMMRFAVAELQRRGVSDDRIYVSMERNMKCAIGLCGHCQYGSEFICKDGPVFAYDRIAPLFGKAEV